MTDLHRIASAHLGNLRDLGGRATSDGTLVATGVAYRSAELSDEAVATDPDLATLAIRTVVDLRTAAERAAAPDQVPAGAELVVLDVLADLPGGAAAQLAELFERPGSSEDAAGSDAGRGGAGPGALAGVDLVAQMVETYRALVSTPSAQKAYAGLVRLVIDPDRVPLLFHCTAGKDRTGWAATVLLLAAGATREEALDEYLAVNPAVHEIFAPLLERVAASGVGADALRPLFEVRAEYLQAAFDELDREFGTFEAYLRDGLGLTEIEREALARTLRAR
ncbi:MAG: tyrosine-protein phosphatase [Brevundimonas sp.]